MALSIKLTNVDKTFKDASEEVNKLINSAQRISALQATSELRQVTPVDTGRARGSWSFSKIARNFKDAKNQAILNPILGPIPSDTIETLYITNGTPYIQELNQGTSKQAPVRFVEKTVSKYFELRGGSVSTF